MHTARGYNPRRDISGDCIHLPADLYMLLLPWPAAKVVDLKKEAGKGFSFEELKAAVEQHKPAVLFLCQVWACTDHPCLPALQTQAHACHALS